MRSAVIRYNNVLLLLLGICLVADLNYINLTLENTPGLQSKAQKLPSLKCVV